MGPYLHKFSSDFAFLECLSGDSFTIDISINSDDPSDNELS
jgi:hypothetical protein